MTNQQTFAAAVVSFLIFFWSTFFSFFSDSYICTVLIIISGLSTGLLVDPTIRAYNDTTNEQWKTGGEGLSEYFGTEF